METNAIVGLGYVGLPLAVAFGKLGPTVGYDLSPKIGAFREHIDPRGTVSDEDLRAAAQLTFTSHAAGLAHVDCFINRRRGSRAATRAAGVRSWRL